MENYPQKSDLTLDPTSSLLHFISRQLPVHVCVEYYDSWREFLHIKQLRALVSWWNTWQRLELLEIWRGGNGEYLYRVAGWRKVSKLVKGILNYRKLLKTWCLCLPNLKPSLLSCRCNHPQTLLFQQDTRMFLSGKIRLKSVSHSEICCICSSLKKISWLVKMNTTK